MKSGSLGHLEGVNISQGETLPEECSTWKTALAPVVVVDPENNKENGNSILFSGDEC